MVDLFRNGYQRFRVFVDIALRQMNFWVSISGISGEYSVHYTIFFFHAWFKFEFKKKAICGEKDFRGMRWSSRGKMETNRGWKDMRAVAETK